MVNHLKGEVFSRRMDIAAMFETTIMDFLVDTSLVWFTSRNWGDFVCSGSLDYLENSLTSQFESISIYQASFINHVWTSLCIGWLPNIPFYSEMFPFPTPNFWCVKISNSWNLAKEEGIIQETAEEILQVEARCVDWILPKVVKKSWRLKIEILCNWKVETIQAKQKPIL